MAQICTEVHEWFESWIEKRVEKCRQRKCKRWCLCCNKWLCWMETILERVTQWVVRIVCTVVSVALDAVAGLVGLILAIPVLGRVIRQIWSFILEVVWRGVGIGGSLLDWLGVDIEKNYRLCFIVLSDATGQPMIQPVDLQPAIQSASTVWKNAANVRLVVEDIHIVIKTDVRERNLDVECDSGAWTDDLLLTGSNFELFAITYCFYGAGRRLFGLAPPVVVFIVRTIKNKDGCSLGLFADYVTIEGKDPHCLAHELAHVTLPWGHHDDPANLLHSGCGGTQLKEWQRILMRNSRYVTYF